MKAKRVAACVALFILLFSFSSCSVFSSSEDAVVGRWSLTVENEGTKERELVFHFTEDGKINLEQQDGDRIPYSIFFGTYVVDGKEIFVYSEGEVSVCTFSVSKERLTLTPQEGETVILNRLEE